MVVKKYIILAYSNDKTFDIPRQMVEINGEPLLKRTIRLLKENGIENIIVTGNNEKYKELGVKLYSSKNNDYNYIKHTGYWLNAFDFELMDEPVCFIWGDVYFSEEAIKKIVETNTDSTLFFCTYNNKSPLYIKHHDEPLAYKVVDTDLFKKHIIKVKKMKDDGLCCREPIVWEVYRSIHNQDINTHEMTTDYVAINDISCDIDSQSDLDKIKEKLGGLEMIKVEVIEHFSYGDFDKIKDTLVRGSDNIKEGYLFIGDIFECNKEQADYLLGKNKLERPFVKVIEVKQPIAEGKIEYPTEPVELKATFKKIETPTIVRQINKPKKTKLTKKN